MPKHIANKPVVTHRLELSDAEAYQIWHLSFRFEGGDDYPKDGVAARVHCFFDTETDARFDKMNTNGVKPIDYLKEERE